MVDRIAGWTVELSVESGLGCNQFTYCNILIITSNKISLSNFNLGEIEYHTSEIRNSGMTM